MAKKKKSIDKQTEASPQLKTALEKIADLKETLTSSEKQTEASPQLKTEVKTVGGPKEKQTEVSPQLKTDEPKEKLWFGMKRWVVLGLAAAILILLFAPLFAVTKTVSTTETVITTVTTQEPYTVVNQKNIKVYTGWLKVTDQSSGNPSGYYPMPPIIIYGGGGHHPHPWDQSGSGYSFSMQQQQQQQTYGGYPSYGYGYNYGSQTATTTQVDPSDEVIDVQYSAAPDNTWDITLISQDGKQKIIRGVNEYDLTKTGDATVEVTETENKTIVNQVPQQVTKEVPVQLRVGLFQLIFGIY